MDLKDNDNDNEPKDEKEDYDFLKIPLNIKEVKCLLKIFPSDDDSNIIFKLEIDKIQTYYYSENFDLRDFRQKNKLFISDDNIQELFSHLKEIKKNCTISIEKKVMKVYITFKSNIDTNFNIDFILKKKVVPQNRLNPQLVEQIQDNKNKIKMLKKQITKLNKAIQLKTETINDFNNSIANINSIINNINTNSNTQNLNLNNNSDDENNNKNNDDEEEELIKENYSNKEEKQEEKRYISNNRKRKNKKQNKKIKFIHIENNRNSNNNTLNNQDNTVFCFENVEILGNKKIFEVLVIFNIITILIILCLLGSIYSIKSDLEYEKLMEDEFMKKLSYLNIVNENNEDEPIKRSNDFNENDKLKNSLFENEKQELFFKEEIIKKGGDNIKDVDFILKYSSVTDSKNFDIFYNNCKGVLENLILFKNNRGKKYGLFTKNIDDVLRGKTPKNSNEFQNNFILYSFSSYDILEYSFKNYIEIYSTFIQSIFKFFSNDEIPFQNKYNDMQNKRYNGQQILGTLVEIEIYQVKFIK